MRGNSTLLMRLRAMGVKTEDTGESVRAVQRESSRDRASSHTINERDGWVSVSDDMEGMR